MTMKIANIKISMSISKMPISKFSMSMLDFKVNVKCQNFKSDNIMVSISSISNVKIWSIRALVITNRSL